MLDDASPTAYGSKMLLRTVNSGTTTISDRLELTDQNNTHYSESHNFKNSGSTANIATFTTASITFSADLSYNRTFGSFINTATITPASADTVYYLPITTLSTSSNMTLSNTGTVTIQKAGHYNIQFSIQLNNADNQEHQFDVWLRKNGSDVANSNTSYDLLKQAKSVASLTFTESFAANDTFEIMYAVNSTQITMTDGGAISSPYVRPATPSVILNVIPVGA
jgi:hypothetical protein